MAKRQEHRKNPKLPFKNSTHISPYKTSEMKNEINSPALWQVIRRSIRLAVSPLTTTARKRPVARRRSFILETELRNV